VKSIRAFCVWGSLAGLCGVACGDGEGSAGDTTETGGREAIASSGGALPASGGANGGMAPSSGGRATGGVVSTFGGFESTGGRSATGGAAPSATGGESSGECESSPPPEGLVYDGDLLIASAEELQEAREYSEITGSLTIALEEVELPRLVRVGGDVSSAAMRMIRLPALTDVGGSIYYYLDPGLEILDLRSLVSVGDRFYLHRNRELRELQIDALAEVGGTFDISANLELADCFLDVVTTRFPVLHTTAPECTCSRRCGFVTASCE